MLNEFLISRISDVGWIEKWIYDAHLYINLNLTKGVGRLKQQDNSRESWNLLKSM